MIEGEEMGGEGEHGCQKDDLGMWKEENEDEWKKKKEAKRET